MLQEALLRVWQVAPRCAVDGRPNGLLRLGLRIARNLAISAARRERGEPLGDPVEETVEWTPPDPHLRQAVQDCREQLPRQPGRALSARLEASGGEPDRSLAERVGMKLNTFLQNITRARRLLADCLRRRGVDLDLELS